MSSLGIKVKNARETQGMTQDELAAKAGVTQPYINMIEKNKVKPSIKALNKISSALRIDPAYFVEKNAGMFFEEYKEHFNEKEMEFLSEQENKPWITMSQELKDKGLTPEQVKEMLKMLIEASKFAK